jgi:hypothetical protein
VSIWALIKITVFLWLIRKTAKLTGWLLLAATWAGRYDDTFDNIPDDPAALEDLFAASIAGVIRHEDACPRGRGHDALRIMMWIFRSVMRRAYAS